MTACSAPPLGADGKPVRWWRQLAAAVRVNASNEGLWHVVADTLALDDTEAMLTAAEYVRELLPYKFDGPKHRIIEVSGSLRRGYAACGDATAALAAFAFMRGIDDVSVCYEATDTLPGYAHVRIVSRGETFDSYPDASLDLPQCAERFCVTPGGVEWPVAARNRTRELLRRVSDSARLLGDGPD